MSSSTSIPDPSPSPAARRSWREAANTWLDWLVEAEQVDADAGRRRRLLVSTSVLLALSSIAFAAQLWHAGGFSLTVALILFGGIAIGLSPGLIRVTHSHQASLAIAMTPALAALAFISYTNSGLASPAMLFLLGVPMLATLVGSPRIGLGYAVFAAMLVGVVLLAHEAGHTFHGTPEPYITRARALAMVTLMVANFVISWVFERDRLRAEAAMLRSREDFRHLLAGSSDPMMILHRGRIRFANAAMAGLLETPSGDELVGRTFFSLIFPADRTELVPRLRSVLSGDAPPGEEISFRNQRGTQQTVRVQRIERVDFGGQSSRLVVVRNIADEKRMEAQLRVADRMASVGNLAAGVAHEVNNPLTYVMTNLQFVAELAEEVVGGSDPAELREGIQALQEALDGAEQVQRIVYALQSFSRASSTERRFVDVDHVIQSVVRMASHEVTPRARLELDIADDLPRLWADEPQLSQLFLNLLVNAAQAIPAGELADHRIRVTAKRTAAPAAVTVTIEDTGRGIDEAVIEQVFDPFFTTRPVGQGTGLGLAIAHGIVRGLKGQLSIANNKERGVTATVTLPADGPAEVSEPRDAEHASVMPRPLSGPAPAARRLLVVDDAPQVIQAIRRHLGEGYDVEMVADGKTALEHLVADDFDVVFCDLTAPERSGMDLYRDVRRLMPEEAERFVFMIEGTAVGEAGAFVAEEAAERPCLEKPLSSERLHTVVAPLLATSTTVVGAFDLP